MSHYKCGHASKPLLLDDNVLSALAYDEWKDTEGWNGTQERCFDCWCREQDRHIMRPRIKYGEVNASLNDLTELAKIIKKDCDKMQKEFPEFDAQRQKFAIRLKNRSGYDDEWELVKIWNS